MAGIGARVECSNFVELLHIRQKLKQVRADGVAVSLKEIYIHFTTFDIYMPAFGRRLFIERPGPALHHCSPIRPRFRFFPSTVRCGPCVTVGISIKF